MKLFACRWPNGDISFVNATDEREAIQELDEAGDAEGRFIFPVKDFMLHLKLGDTGHLLFEDFGARTMEQVMPVAYPSIDKCYEQAAQKNDGLEPTDAALRLAVEAERNRIPHSR